MRELNIRVSSRNARRETSEQKLTSYEFAPFVMADLAESDGSGRCDENNQCREPQRNSYRSA